MSEVLYNHEIARDLDKALDKVLRYTPPERTALDIVLIEEAEIVASARVKHLYEIFDTEDVTGSLARSFRADSFYNEEYPDADWRKDASLLGLSAMALNGSQILFEYGSDDVRNDMGLQFANKYEYSANKAILNCVHHRLNIHQAQEYLTAVHNFTSELHELGHVSEDSELLEPLFSLGNCLAKILLNFDDPDFSKKWRTHLQEKVINKFDFIGEDGRVGEDMTESIWSWVEKQVLKYNELQDFEPPDPRYCYGYDDSEDSSVEQDRFTPYGSDAPYFREIERRRLESEEEAAS